MPHRQGLTLVVVALAASLARAAPAGGPPFPVSCRAPAPDFVRDGWRALAHAHVDQARDAFAIALRDDADCVLARATLATLLVGPRGQRQLDRALEQADRLTPLEKLELQRLVAQRNGEGEEVLRLAREMTALAPANYQARLMEAKAALSLQRYEEASDAARVATAIAPTEGAAWNLLGYAELGAGHKVDAVAAFEAYVDVTPLEPNAHDSLGEALLASDRLDAAEMAFRKALELSHDGFANAWSGVATVKALRGDWSAARGALGQQKRASTQPQAQLECDLESAWTYAAEGRLKDAVQVVEGVQREAARWGVDAMRAQAVVVKGEILLALGQEREALAVLTKAADLEPRTATPAQVKAHRVRALTALTVAQARRGDVRSAEKSLGTLRTYLRQHGLGPLAGNAVAWAHGAVALARKDREGAVEALQHCAPDSARCRLALLEAQELAGDDAGAEETRKALITANTRDAESWFVRAWLEARRRVSGT